MSDWEQLELFPEICVEAVEKEAGSMSDTDDVVEWWNGLTKGQLWAMAPGEVYNWMDEAVEEIERLRLELDHVYRLWEEASAEWDRLAEIVAQLES